MHGHNRRELTLASRSEWRLGVRYSQSLLSGRRSTGLPAKEPIQEPTWTDFRRHPATPGDCQAWSGAHSATPSDARNVTGGQGVAGSNPAVPTGSDNFFEYTSTPSEPTKEPFVCEMALLAARADHVSRRPTRAFVKPAGPGKPTSQGVKDH